MTAAELAARAEQFIEQSRWREALMLAERLIRDYPTTPQAQDAQAGLATLRANVEIQDRRQFENEFKAHRRAGRGIEALRVAEAIIARFPNSPQARLLREAMPGLLSEAEASLVGLSVTDKLPSLLASPQSLANQTSLDVSDIVSWSGPSPIPSQPAPSTSAVATDAMPDAVSTAASISSGATPTQQPPPRDATPQVHNSPKLAIPLGTHDDGLASQTFVGMAADLRVAHSQPSNPIGLGTDASQLSPQPRLSDTGLTGDTPSPRLALPTELVVTPGRTSSPLAAGDDFSQALDALPSPALLPTLSPTPPAITPPAMPLLVEASPATPGSINPTAQPPDHSLVFPVVFYPQISELAVPDVPAAPSINQPVAEVPLAKPDVPSPSLVPLAAPTFPPSVANPVVANPSVASLASLSPKATASDSSVRAATPAATTSDLADSQIGRQYGGYRILKRLGRGGLGVVYEAQDIRIRRRVALKLIAPEMIGVEGSVERFLREGQAASRVDHPNVVTIFAVGEDNGMVYLAMTLVRGGSVQDRIAAGAKFTPAQLTGIIRMAALGLEAVHSAGIIHRDVKPANIMLSDVGEVRIADFGTAKLTEGTQNNLTQTGALVGTPHYMSPEQCLSEPVDARSDVYSLGVSYYRLLAGRPPFSEGNFMSILRQHVVDPPPDPRRFNPAIPELCIPIIFKALAKSPADRYQRCSDFAAALALVEQRLHQREDIDAEATHGRPAAKLAITGIKTHDKLRDADVLSLLNDDLSNSVADGLDEIVSASASNTPQPNPAAASSPGLKQSNSNVESRDGLFEDGELIAELERVRAGMSKPAPIPHAGAVIAAAPTSQSRAAAGLDQLAPAPALTHQAANSPQSGIRPIPHPPPPPNPSSSKISVPGLREYTPPSVGQRHGSGSGTVPLPPGVPGGADPKAISSPGSATGRVTTNPSGSFRTRSITGGYPPGASGSASPSARIESGLHRVPDPQRLTLPLQVSFKFRFPDATAARAGLDLVRREIRDVLRRKTITPTVGRGGARVALLEFAGSLTPEEHIGVAKSLIFAGGEFLGLLADDLIVAEYLRQQIDRLIRRV